MDSERSPWDILTGKPTVSYTEAGQALGIRTRRRIEQLVKSGALTACGADKSHNRRIMVDSIIKYGNFGIPSTNVRTTANNREEERNLESLLRTN